MRYNDDDYDRFADEIAEERAARRRSRYRCGGFASYYGPCGATDCDSCYPGGGYGSDEEPEEQEKVVSKLVIARKARFVGLPSEIRPGDKVRVTSGFTYTSNGPRTGYFRRYVRVSKGPAWAEAVMAA